MIEILPRQQSPRRPQVVPACIERALSPGIGTCYRCNRPWKCPAMKQVGPKAWQQLGHDRFFGLVGVEEHATPYGEMTPYGQMRGCFPLCEGCWSSLSIPERMPYYERLIAKRKAMGSNNTEADFTSIRESVMKGL